MLMRGKERQQQQLVCTLHSDQRLQVTRVFSFSFGLNPETSKTTSRAFASLDDYRALSNGRCFGCGIRIVRRMSAVSEREREGEKEKANGSRYVCLGFDRQQVSWLVQVAGR